jgi:hypothetical protein
MPEIDDDPKPTDQADAEESDDAEKSDAPAVESEVNQERW